MWPNPIIFIAVFTVRNRARNYDTRYHELILHWNYPLGFEPLIGGIIMRPIVKPKGQKFPYSIMCSPNHPVVLMNFINWKSFTCATSETTSKQPRRIVAIRFLYKALHPHSRCSTVSSSISWLLLQKFICFTITRNITISRNPLQFYHEIGC